MAAEYGHTLDDGDFVLVWVLCEGSSTGLETMSVQCVIDGPWGVSEITDHSCSTSTNNYDLLPAIFEQAFRRHGMDNSSSGIALLAMGDGGIEELLLVVGREEQQLCLMLSKVASKCIEEVVVVVVVKGESMTVMMMMMMMMMMMKRRKRATRARLPSWPSVPLVFAMFPSQSGGNDG